MKKAKVLVAICVILIVAETVSVCAFHNPFFWEWGKYISENAKTDEGDYSIIAGVYENANNEKIKEDDIYYIGRDIIISKNEVNQVIEFYTSSGYTEKEAQEMGINYVKRYNAMYIDALKNGFYVTDEEVENKIESLKELFKTAANREEIVAVFDAFSSEEAYWEYEYHVYEKSLPIEKYREALEIKYMEKNAAGNVTGEAYNEWLDWYSEFQNEVAEGQKFILFKDLSKDERIKYLAEFK